MNSFEISMLAAKFKHHRVPLIKARRNIYLVTLKGQVKNLTSGQGYVRSHVDLNRSCCISGDASWQEEHNETMPVSVTLFNPEFLAKTCF